MTKETVCYGCEGNPTRENSPCTVCGRRCKDPLTSNPVNKEPNLGDYIERWSKKYLAPSAQEMGAREEYASDLSRFLRAEIKRLRAMAKNAWEHGEFECAECVADLNREFGLPPKRSSPDETTDKPRLTGQCDSCHRGWTVIGETGADVIVKAFHCPCGHTTVMD